MYVCVCMYVYLHIHETVPVKTVRHKMFAKSTRKLNPYNINEPLDIKRLLGAVTI